MRRFVLGVVVSSIAAASAAAQASFRNFESAQVHPLRVSSDGTRLFAVNTPDDRLEVYSLADPDRPVLIRDIPVGLQPVSVTPRSNDEVWVANCLSDSISVVSVELGAVVATLRVVDEPADVAFAGSYAFVSASASDEVHVFDAATRALVTKVPIFGKDPRALCVKPGGTAVYVLVHRSGNGTTLIPENLAPAPPPPQNGSLPPAPSQGIIVRATDPAWQSYVTWTQPDYDVAEISVASLTVTRNIPAVGTTNFDLAVHPVSGDLYVANTDARNLQRFEQGVAGHTIDSRVSRVTTGPTPSVTAWDLNPGFTYAGFPNLGERALALAEPTGIALDAAGGRLHVAAQGTDRIGVLDLAGNVLARIEVGDASGATLDTLDKRGPRGLALHPTQPRLYVSERLSHSLTVIDTVTRTVLREQPHAFDPMPSNVRQGSKFQYEAKLSGSGAVSCASCHVDSDIDALAWDLGDPNGTLVAPPTQPFPFNLGLTQYHPMKGPMTTQTLRGLKSMSPFHWRGEKPDLASFNSGFAGVLAGSLLSAGNLNLYVAFLESLEFPPNPRMNLDRTLKTTPSNANQAVGAAAFQEDVGGGLSCVACHSLPNGSNRMVISAQTLNEPQQQKVPQARNLYRKNGLQFGTGPAKAGFGFTHDGAMDTLASFLALPVFNAWPSQTKDDIVEFLLAFDTGMAPTVGYQVTADASNASSAGVIADVALLESQAFAVNCNLVVKGVYRGEQRGLVFSTASSNYQSDLAGFGPFTSAQLRAQALAGDATWTFEGVAPGSAQRIGVDRDLDGTLDGQEGVANSGGASVGCAGEPIAFASSEPRVGNALFALVCANLPANTAGLMAVRDLSSGVALRASTSPAFLGSALVSSDADGWAFSHQPIPNDAALIGRTFAVQFRFADACSPHGRVKSDVLTVTVRP